MPAVSLASPALDALRASRGGPSRVPRARSRLVLADAAAEAASPTASGRTSDRVTLGTSDLSVSAVGVGAWAWGDRSGYWSSDWQGDRAKNAEAYRALLAGGVDFIDTAEVYGFGKSEELVGAFAREHAVLERETGVSPVLATKFAPLPPRFAPEDVPKALQASLDRLGAKKVGLYMQHWPAFGLESLVGIDYFNDAFLEGLCLAYERGLCDAVGVSNFNARRVKAAAKKFRERGVPFASNQVQYSLVYRDAELVSGVKEACDEEGVAVVAYSPMAQGLLTGKYAGAGGRDELRGPRSGVFTEARLDAADALIAAMREIGEAKGGKTPAQVAVNYCATKGAVPIPGARNARQARSVAGCLGWRLDEGEVAELEKIAKTVPVSPGAPFEKW
mgnify:CR=1 FL=1